MKAGVAIGRVTQASWVLFLVALPISNFPFFPPSLGGDALVRPLSLYPLLLLLILVTIPRLLRNPLPRTFIALLPFILAASASSLLSLLPGTDSLLGVSVGERILRAMITLGVGVSIYFTVALYPQTPAELRSALRWIYLGAALAMAWGTLQAIYVLHFDSDYFTWANKLQGLIATRPLFESRVSGPTYEPNWFAKQTCLVTIPWLLAAILRKESVFRWRLSWLTLEWLLLGWSVLLITLTFSRAGLAQLLLMIFIGVAFLRPARQNQSRSTPRLLRRILEASVAMLLVSGAILLLGSNNAFFARVWSYWQEQRQTSLAAYFEFLGFGARVTFGSTAYRIYQQHPAVGVGLGNYAFHFEENLPDRLLAETPEVLKLLTQNADRYRLITPKNLYLRILAETGLFGFGTFLVYLIAITGGVMALWFLPGESVRYWAAGGVLILVSFAFSGLSFDSFAFPDMWVSFGMITAAVVQFIPSERRCLAVGQPDQISLPSGIQA